MRISQLKVLFTANRYSWLWVVILLFAGLLTLIPLLSLFSFSDIDTAIWSHLWRYQLPTLLLNTLTLLVGVGFGVLLLGLSLAGLVSHYEFPTRSVLQWALMLPMALPAYVLAFTLLGWFDYSGPAQSFLRPIFGDVSQWLNLRSRWGVVLVLSLAFYPYVYLLAKEGFAQLGQRGLEIGQSLGLTPWQSFWRVVLPSTRPWWFGGLSLALMETVADFGTVSVLNFDTFTTAIYKAWFSLFSFQTAQQLASLLIVVVFFLVWSELRARGQRSYQALSKSPRLVRHPLRGWRALLANLYAWGILLIACALPVAQLLSWLADDFSTQWLRTAPVLWQSLQVAAVAACCVLLLAWLLSYAQRYSHWRGVRVWVKAVTLGYAVPGSILAVAFFAPLVALDGWLIDLGWLGSGQTWFKGSLLGLMLAYMARFLAVGFFAVDGAMQGMGAHHEEVARSLGSTGWNLWRRIHLPLLSSGVWTGFLMVFVDVLKEMPMTLMARPYDINTLATRIFGLVSEGDWQGAAMPALALVVLGILPVLLIARRS